MVVSVLAKTGFSPIVYKGNLEETIIKLKDIGYDGVELGGIRVPIDINIPGVLKLLEENQMHVTAVGTAQPYFDEGLSFSDPDKQVRKEAVKRVKEIIKLASNFNTSIMVSLIFGKIKDFKDSFKRELEIAKERISDCLDECLDFSMKYSSNFLIEPLNRYETNIFNNFEDTSSFLDNYKHKFDMNRIGLIADTFHMNIEEPVIQKSFDKYKNFIKHIHFSDSNRCAPGYGHINFSEIIETIKKNEYDGFISFEMLPFPDPDTSAINAIDFIKNLWNAVK